MDMEKPATNRYLDHPERQDDEVYLGLDNGTFGGEVVWIMLRDQLQTLRQGKAYPGQVELFGKMRDTTFTPIFEKKSEARGSLRSGDFLGGFSTLIDPELFEALYSAEEIKEMGIKLGPYRR